MTTAQIQFCGFEQRWIWQHAMLLMESLGGFGGLKRSNFFFFYGVQFLGRFSTVHRGWMSGKHLTVERRLHIISVAPPAAFLSDKPTGVTTGWWQSVLSQFSCCDNIRSALSVMTSDGHLKNSFQGIVVPYGVCIQYMCVCVRVRQ